MLGIYKVFTVIESRPQSYNQTTTYCELLFRPASVVENPARASRCKPALIRIYTKNKVHIIPSVEIPSMARKRVVVIRVYAEGLDIQISPVFIFLLLALKNITIADFGSRRLIHAIKYAYRDWLETRRQKTFKYLTGIILIGYKNEIL